MCPLLRLSVIIRLVFLNLAGCHPGESENDEKLPYVSFGQHICHSTCS